MTHPRHAKINLYRRSYDNSASHNMKNRHKKTILESIAKSVQPLVSRISTNRLSSNAIRYDELSSSMKQGNPKKSIRV